MQDFDLALQEAKQSINQYKTALTHPEDPPIVKAVSTGDLAAVETIIQEDITQIDWKSPAGHTLLTLAISGGHRSIAERLLAAGAPQTPSSELGYTPLHLAAIRGDKFLCFKLIAAGADPRIRAHADPCPAITPAFVTIPSSPALATALSDLDTLMPQSLILAASMPTVPHAVQVVAQIVADLVKAAHALPSDLDPEDEDLWRKLLAHDNLVSAMKVTPTQPIPPSVLDAAHVSLPQEEDVSRAGGNALKLYHWALLLSQPRPPTPPTPQIGRRAAHAGGLASFASDLKQELLSSEVVKACSEGDVATMRRLLGVGSPPEGAEDWGAVSASVAMPPNLDTLLHTASSHGRLEAAQLLVQCGVSPNAANVYKHTPLHVAARLGQMDLLAFLLDAGSSVSTKTSDGRLAIHEAAGQGHAAAVSLLLSRGSDVDAGYPETPLVEAVQHGGNAATVQLLLDAGASPIPLKSGAEPPQSPRGPGIDGREAFAIDELVAEAIARVEAAQELARTREKEEKAVAKKPPKRKPSPTRKKKVVSKPKTTSPIKKKKKKVG